MSKPNKYFWLLIWPVFFFLLNFSGCATIATKEPYPSYNLNGVQYLPLRTLCEVKNIDLQYDAFANTVTLNKDNHRIALLVGDNIVLVDGRAQYISYPVDIYEGALVVPHKFKEQVLDNLFRQNYAVKRALPALLRLRKIVLDAGHGGNDPGAIGRSGLKEKDVNLDIARRVANILRADGVNVVMTRSSDKFIPLPKRVDIANHSQADMFVAIHSNANRVRSLNGFEIYYVAPSVSDSNRAQEAARYASLDIPSSCFASNSMNLKATLWDMIYTYNRAESIALSRSVCKAMEDSLGVRILGVKAARFEVLRGARMPAILVETGFLSNPTEERMLRNGFYREKVAQGIVRGIYDYSRSSIVFEAAKR